jgi:hypothetical protein
LTGSVGHVKARLYASFPRVLVAPKEAARLVVVHIAAASITIKDNFIVDISIMKEGMKEGM